jgi:hypothetical protein
MIMKLSELKNLVRKGIALFREDYTTDADGAIDMADPIILRNNTYDMNDQETTTKVANRRINPNPPGPDVEPDEVERAILKFTGESKKLRKRTQVDSNGCEVPAIVKKYAKPGKMPADKPLSMAKIIPKDNAKNKAKDKKMMLAKGKAKVKEDKYPDKAGWQGGHYRGNKEKIAAKKVQKKEATPLAKATGTCDEAAPKGWEGTIKAMKKDKKKGKTKIDNPWALAHYMKNKGFKSHRTKTGKKK